MKIKKILIFLFILTIQSFGNRILSVRRYQANLKKEIESEKATGEILEQQKDNNILTTKEKRNSVSSKERSVRKKIVETALSKLNTPYLWGASGSNKFDCSSFIQYVYKQSINLSLPRISYEQADFGKKINYRNLKPGDVLAFDTLNKNHITHVGLYIGNNQFIHASSGYGKVVVSELTGFYAEKFRYGVKIIWKS